MPSWAHCPVRARCGASYQRRAGVPARDLPSLPRLLQILHRSTKNLGVWLVQCSNFVDHQKSRPASTRALSSREGARARALPTPEHGRQVRAIRNTNPRVFNILSDGCLYFLHEEYALLGGNKSNTSGAQSLLPRLTLAHERDVLVLAKCRHDIRAYLCRVRARCCPTSGTSLIEAPVARAMRPGHHRGTRSFLPLVIIRNRVRHT